MKDTRTHLTSVSESSLAVAYKVFSFDNELSPGFSTTSGAALEGNKRSVIIENTRKAIQSNKTGL